MKLLPRRLLTRYLLIICLALTGFLALALNAHAQKADTVSSAGVQFTSIPTAADSIAMRKQMNKTLAATKDAMAQAQAASALTQAQASTKKVKAGDTAKPQTLWEIFWTGVASGFGAFFLPCIYPLLPLTVSFFTKLGGSKLKGSMLSLLYMSSIIIIYVSLGLVLTIFFGPDTMNAIATSGVFNILIFTMLLVFGISFLGAFEITLPGSLVNKIDTMSDKGGLVGIFFMALTLVVVSFSCTGGVVAADLGAAFSKGERIGPAISMLGFSSALALPFTIFSFFPSAMQSLPKSGGWLNNVKVVLGFIEIAFALKFLSNVDLAYHWNWFDREIFLSLWIALTFFLGFYLIGKIKFSHDSDLPYISVPRLFISLIVFAFAIYMIPGLWGAPLKSISAYLPPIGTQDFDLSQTPGGNPNVSVSLNMNDQVKHKYAENYTRIKTRGLDAWYDYDQALQASKDQHKPIMIDFTGFNCVNCRKMESDVWSNPSVFKHLRDDYILLQLVVDDKADLVPSEQFVSTYSGKKITTLGGKWSDFEASKFNVNSQPFYVILDSNGNMLLAPQGANYNVDNYLKFLESGIAAYKK